MPQAVETTNDVAVLFGDCFTRAPACAPIKVKQAKENGNFPQSPAEACEPPAGVKPDVPQDALSPLSSQPKTGDIKHGKVDEPIGKPGKAKRGAPPLPRNARSYTDEEYEEIFQAVIDRTLSASVALQDDFDAVLDEVKDLELVMDHEVLAKEDEPEKQATQEKHEKDVDKEVAEGNVEDIEIAAELQQQEPEQNQQPDFQAENENTPLTSDQLQIQKKIAKTPPIVCRKKNMKSIKKNKLPPKDLEFSKEKNKKRKLVPDEGKDGVKKSQPKKIKKVKEEVSKQKRMANREVEEEGIWVQCSLKACQKWRILKDVHDPTLVPEDWKCSMNTDPKQNSCDDPEAEFDPETEHEDFIYTEYAEGSLVWARMGGYPWWPGMVEADPDFHVHFDCRSKPNEASHFHVVFLDKNVTRAWFSAKNIKPFTGEDMGSTRVRGKCFKKPIELAKTHATEALKMTLAERIRCYGFAARFKGHWGEISATTGIDGEKQQKVSSGAPGRHAKQTTKNLNFIPDIDYPCGGSFCGLSTEEVDEILDNVETIIDDANDVLNELLSQDDDDEYLFPDSPKQVKKSKGDKIEKAPKKAKGKKPKEKSTKDGKNEKSLGKKEKKTVKKLEVPQTKKTPVQKGSPPSSAFPKKEKLKLKPMIPPKKNKAVRPKETNQEKEVEVSAKQAVENVITSSPKDSSQESNSTKVTKLDEGASAVNGQTTKKTTSQLARKKFVAPAATKPAMKTTSPESKVESGSSQKESAGTSVELNTNKSDEVEEKKEEKSGDEMKESSEGESEGKLNVCGGSQVNADPNVTPDDLEMDLDLEVDHQQQTDPPSMDLDLGPPVNVAGPAVSHTLQPDIDLDFEIEE